MGIFLQNLLWLFMLVSCGCPNKLPPTWRLETETHSLTVLEARSLTTFKFHRARIKNTPSRGSREKYIPCLFQILVAPLLTAASLQFLPPSSHCLFSFVCVLFPSVFLLQRYFWLDLGPLDNSGWPPYVKVLLNHTPRIIFPYKLTFTGFKD